MDLLATLAHMDQNGPGDGDLLTSAEERRELERLRAEFPTYSIDKIFGGWQAVPRGTVVLRGMYLETIAERLRTSCTQSHQDES